MSRSTTRHDQGAPFPTPTPAPHAAERDAAIDLSAEEFRRIGHALIDDIAALLASVRERPVAPGLPPRTVRAALGTGPLPDRGAEPGALLARATELLGRYSTFNGHPRFFGYITAGPAPLGALGELLAASVNPNAGAWSLSPIASEIERQTVRWLAELLGYPTTAGGLLLSGGNMANIVAALAARRARAGWDVHEHGVVPPDGRGPLLLYGSTETHTWVQKAAEIMGLGTRSIRWIPVDAEQRMDVDALRRQLRADRDAGRTPFMVIGTAGTVSTGAIDPLGEIAAVCREHVVWFHVDGAYGAPAAALPEASADLRALAEADSLAFDPHKWLYAPLEAGCVLVRDAESLHDTFHHAPPYYHFGGDPDDAPTNFHEWGPQNSRGFRALKVWLALQQVGREGYVRMIRDDIALARAMADHARTVSELEVATCRLSIATFRYVPPELRARVRPAVATNAPEPNEAEAYVDRLNTAILSAIQDGGEAYLSNAVIGGRFHLRACIVNFRTTLADVVMVPELVVRVGRELDAEMRPR